jgi:hypothetical protein
MTAVMFMKARKRAIARRSLITFGAGLLAVAGLFSLPATMTAASAATAVPANYPCTLTAYYPLSNGFVRSYATMSCSGAEYIQVETCLEQLVTGGWQNVVGSCKTSPEAYGTYISATGQSYYPTCGRYYRTWAWGYNGETGTTLSSAYKGCS